jgi:alpha-galactosidase
LEWSGIGQGDYRFSPAELKMPNGSFTNDFVYSSHSITSGCAPMDALPFARSDQAVTLTIVLTDAVARLELHLLYTVFAQTDVIARRCILHATATDSAINSSPANDPLLKDHNLIAPANGDKKASVVIRKLMSMMFDLPDPGLRLITFDGDWISEGHRHDRPLAPGLYINSSTTGASSNRHNPGFLLAAPETSEDRGLVYGFNLLYSGNHFGAVERSPHGLVRIAIGINPHCFEWELPPGGHFATPQAIMTCSDSGFNSMSQHFHDFINQQIVPEYWQGRERPVLYNSWEAHFFKFNNRKLLKTARHARSLGIELFVLDDGWFGERNNDKTGLGDYNVNRRKLPQGLPAFAHSIRKMGMEFGLWFEPEMVNEDSDLFRSHPDWAVRTPHRTPTLGRHQLVLDLTNPKVRDYIVRSVGTILDNTGVTYVKWDMNRHISDAYSPLLSAQGEFFHRYILGLYDLLKRLFTPRPHILLESCSSGGNRFDLGMLTFGPQIWTSDCTDPIERLSIQGGLSYLYPPSTFGAHVSDAPHQQTLRQSPLATRFHAACFGCLGYELELSHLTRMERAEIRDQIAFYKLHRPTLQFGRFRREEARRDNIVQWQCTEKDRTKALAGFFQTLARANPVYDRLSLSDLTDTRSYRVSGRPQRVFIKQFGGLIKHVLPVNLNPNGWLMGLINRVFALNDCAEEYVGDGHLLQQGIWLNNQFMGSYYTAETRLLGDFGSNLYLITATGHHS